MKKHANIFNPVIILAVLFGCGLNTAFAKVGEFESLMVKGKKEFAAGRFGKALGFYEKALKIQPENIKANAQLVYSFAGLKQTEKAVALYREKIAAAPEKAVYHYALGIAFELLEKNSEALSAYAEAVRLAPETPQFHYGLGNIYGMLGDGKKAIAEMQEVLRLDPKYADAYTVLALENQYLGNLDEAIKFLDEAKRLSPNDEYILTNRLPVLLALNRGAETAADAEKFLSVYGWKNAESAYTAILGAVGYRFAGRENEARKLLEKGLKKLDKNAWTTDIIRFLLDKKSAEDLLKLATGNNDKMTEAHCYIGLSLWFADKRDEALTHFQWVVENGNKTFDEYLIAKSIAEKTE